MHFGKYQIRIYPTRLILLIDYHMHATSISEYKEYAK